MTTIEIKKAEADFSFEATDIKDHLVKFDTSDETGGTSFGVRPMHSILMSLGACSGIDIVSILKKQRLTVKDFTMRISGERESGKEPSLWASAHIDFELTGEIETEKAERACALSMNKYCSVAETLRRGGTKITWNVRVNN